MSRKNVTYTRTTLATVGFSLAIGVAAAIAQQPPVRVHGDDITIRGCVGRSSPGAGLTTPTLVWTRSDIMLSNAMSVQAHGQAALTDRVFYWLEDEEDLAKYVGQQVEITGDVGDFKKGEIELKRDGQFTNIEMKLGGKKEKARVPTSWLGTEADKGDITIVSRKVDVDKVKTLGPC